MRDQLQSVVEQEYTIQNVATPDIMVRNRCVVTTQTRSPITQDLIQIGIGGQGQSEVNIRPAVLHPKCR
jgi:hypothetical protein